MPSSSPPAPPSGRAISCAKLGLTAVLAGFVLLGAGLDPAARGQDKKDGKLSILLSHQRTPRKGGEGIQLRPNVQQNVYVFVQNDGDKDRTVTVQMLVDGNPETTQQINAVKGKATLVPFAAAPNAPKQAPLTALSGPVSFRLVEGNAAVAEDVELPVATPSQYATAEARFYPGSEKDKRPNRLEVRVQRKRDFPFVTPPPCHVELDLSRLEGLAPGAKKEGVYSGYLPADAYPLTDEEKKTKRESALVLEARNLRFTTRGEKKAGGYVSLSIDGYPGALVFDGNFDVTKESKESLPRLTTAVCRIGAAPFAAPSPKFPVRLELDANVDLIEKVRLGLRAAVEKDDKGKVVRETFADVAEFPGPRQVTVRYGRGGPGGALVFQPEVAYWSTTIDLSGVTGVTKLRLVATDKDDKAVNVLDGNKPAAKAAKSVEREVRLDDSKPDVLEFVNVPRRAVRGKGFEVGARAEDQESGISRVRFYLGKAFPDEKLPQEVVAVEGAYDEDEEAWITASPLPIPADQASPVRVNVVAVNGVGLAATKSIEVPVVDPPTVITGKVLENNAPVENLDVLLVTPKNVIEDRVKSGKGGVFLFMGVPKGVYRLLAKRKDTRARAERTVVVKDLSPLEDQHLILEEPTTISGKVLEDDVPIENLTVSLLTAKNELRAQTRTTTGGAFTFDGVLKGSYVIRAVRPSTRTVGELAVEVKQLVPIKGLEVLLKTPKGTAAIAGKVLELGSPVDGVTVRLLNDRDEVIDKTQSSGGGKFVFNSLPNGSYTLRGARPSTPSAGEVKVVIRELASLKDVELILKTGKERGSIAGRVTEGDRAQSGVPVQLLNAANVVVTSATTNGQGGFIIEGVPPGSYRVLARKSSSRTQGLVAVEVGDGQQVKGVEVKLYRR